METVNFFDQVDYSGGSDVFHSFDCHDCYDSW
jgi:hypothetical protein